MVGSGSRSFEVSKRCRATSHGGLGLVHEVTVATGLAKEIDASVSVFHARGPYTESDHVLNLAYNIVCGGRTLDDVELRRQDEALLDLLGAERLPGATTAGDFLRRFERSDIDDLAEAFNETRRRVWRHQSEDFFERAVIDIDGTIAPTDGECKEGQDMVYTGEWGYAPLLTTLANTGEILYARNRPGNRPSHEGAFEYLDPAVELVRSAGFRSVRLRGDCHFALTADFGHWCEARVEFVFGMAAHPTLVKLAEGLDAGSWEPMEREPRSTGGRGKPKPRVREAIVKERGYKNLVLESEDIAEFTYRPGKCDRSYRVVALRKTIRVEKGQRSLLPEERYHFYVTNVPAGALATADVVREANQRCNQENLIEQTENGVHAMRMPCDTLLANKAYMTIACLAWNMAAWTALLWPDAAEGKRLLVMEFRRFTQSVILLPCQVVLSGRRFVQRLLSWSPWIMPLMRAHEGLRRLRLA